MQYRTLWAVRGSLPDDRLVYARVDIRLDGAAEIDLALRAGSIHPTLARAMAEFSERFAEARVFDVDPAQVGRPPYLSVWFEAVEDRLCGNLPLNVHYGGVSSKFFTMLVDRDLCDPSFIREMNEEAMPLVCAYLVPNNSVGELLVPN